MTLPILTHSPVLIFLTSGFSGTTIWEPGNTLGYDRIKKNELETAAFPFG